MVHEILRSLVRYDPYETFPRPLGRQDPIYKSNTFKDPEVCIMDCVSKITDTLSTADSVLTSLPSISTSAWYTGVVIVTIVCILLAFVPRVPATALETLAKQMDSIDSSLKDGMVNNVLDAQFTWGCNIRLCR